MIVQNNLYIDLLKVNERITMKELCKIVKNINKHKDFNIMHQHLGQSIREFYKKVLKYLLYSQKMKF